MRGAQQPKSRRHPSLRHAGLPQHTLLHRRCDLEPIGIAAGRLHIGVRGLCCLRVTAGILTSEYLEELRFAPEPRRP